jgi:cell division septal protein FtsQ
VKRALRWIGAGTLGALLVASPLWAPPLLSEIRWFEVRRVEVSGNRHLAPHEVLLASGVGSGQTVWDDPQPWLDALLAHPGIEDAQVTRRLPSTLRVRVREKLPVGYVMERTLLPATAAGEIFPLDPSRAALDLPIVHGPWPDTAAAGPTRATLAALGRLAEMDPGLVSEVSEVRARNGDPAVLVLRHRVGEILLPGTVSRERLAQLRAVLAELERRGSAESGRALVDVRFEAQIVVRHPSSV